MLELKEHKQYRILIVIQSNSSNDQFLMLKIGLQFTSIKKEVIYLSVVIYYDRNDTYVNLIVIYELTDIKIDDMVVKLLLNRKVEGKMIHRFDINP